MTPQEEFYKVLNVIRGTPTSLLGWLWAIAKYIFGIFSFWAFLYGMAGGTPDPAVLGFATLFIAVVCVNLIEAIFSFFRSSGARNGAELMKMIKEEYKNKDAA